MDSKPSHPEAPQSLKTLQASFGLSIAAPLSLPPVAGHLEEIFEINVNDYDVDFLSQVAHTPFKNAIESVATYNQQYWFRLLTIMQQEYPLLLHLMSYREFNQLMIDFLTVHPPADYRLTHLGEKLPAYIRNSNLSDKTMLSEAAQLSFLHSLIFIAGSLPPLKATLAQDQVSKIKLQPHVHFFQQHWELIQAGDVLKNQPLTGSNAALAEQPLASKDEQKLVILKTQQYWALYRDQNRISRLQLGPIQFELLQSFRMTGSLDQAISETAEKCDQSDLDLMSSNLSAWFEKWTRLNWFGLSHAETD